MSVVHRVLLPACVILAISAGTVQAQSYPNRVVRIVTAAAGGGSDFVTRLVATPLSTALGQQVIVDNRGLLAADVAAKAPADGYTLLLSGSTLWLLPMMRDNVASGMADFSAITLATETANILVVHPQLPVKSAGDLLALARAKPGQLNYATSGSGNSVHIAGELFKAMGRVDVIRINYKGATQALVDLASGQTQFMFAVPGSVVPHVKAGRLRALAVTSAKPTPLAPGLPTVSAALPGYESVSRLAFFAPVGTPEPVINLLNQEIVRVLRRPDIRDKLLGAGVEAVGNTARELSALVDAEVRQMGKVIKDAGIRAD